VRYWVEGAERFETADAFPPASGNVRRLYLGTPGEEAATHR
jgi:hypothetical protein